MGGVRRGPAEIQTRDMRWSAEIASRQPPEARGVARTRLRTTFLRRRSPLPIKGAAHNGRWGSRCRCSRVTAFPGLVLDLEFLESAFVLAFATNAMAVIVPMMITAPVFASLIRDVEHNGRFKKEALAVPALGTGNAFKTIGILAHVMFLSL